MAKRPLPVRPSVRDAMPAVATLGGHIKSNGDPGWLLLERGMHDLLLLELGWRAREDAEKRSIMRGMRYLVTARLKDGYRTALRRAIEDRSLGRGSVAGGEYLRDMARARELPDGRVKWVETCFCATPLQEERPYWEEYFRFDSIKDAHARSTCRDENGTEPWSCMDCDCTKKLEGWLDRQGRPFKP